MKNVIDRMQITNQLMQKILNNLICYKNSLFLWLSKVPVLWNHKECECKSSHWSCRVVSADTLLTRALYTQEKVITHTYTQTHTHLDSVIAQTQQQMSKLQSCFAFSTQLFFPHQLHRGEYIQVIPGVIITQRHCSLSIQNMIAQKKTTKEFVFLNKNCQSG